jgi:hypothetical protein
MPTAYIETSIPSYYHETRHTPQATVWRRITRDWWDNHRHGYQLCTSRFVLLEIAQAPPRKAKAAASLVQDVPILEEPPGLETVANYYIEHRAMPETAGGDAYHLAIASLHNLDFLLTWNCQHLANANKIRHLTVLNGRLGLPTPVIVTPLSLMPEDLS